MKKLLPMFFAGVLLVLAACSNDFDVVTDWKEVPVTYAIVSPQDTAHYVRAEKAFLDPKTSALVIARIADSLYYPEDAITVWLERTSNQSRVQLHRVDGVVEGIVRDTGIFATNPNWLYKYKPTPGNELLPGEEYRLIVERTDGQPAITAETTIPQNFNLVKPNLSNIPPLLTFFPSDDTEIEWRADKNAVLFNVKLIIRFREENASGMTLQHVVLEWDVPSQISLTDLDAQKQRGKVFIPGVEFYRFLHDNIQPSTDRFRYFENMDVKIEGGGKEIKEYQLTSAANSGITGAEVFSIYTNMSEGYGLFSSKNVSVFGGIKVNVKTVDSMSVHPLTFDLNFKY
ncbi:MAG: DUF4249 family protein [Lewinellaceae bacterium]|nr:DUF4249 family protein [Saprospiraceae bacterium]MCB0542610.1 DUF4249 family protein [Saprospiraceae bacterium]MCB9305587.1 DUF4249 family protein [Lewinellaceae bacterium]MCB9355017.1 DUF4249 family protein [Lewinellaceae bacterium]